MIRVEMREDDVLDALGSDTRPAELRGHLVRTVELEPGEAEKGVPARKYGLGRSGRLSGVEQTAAGRVIDEVRVHRKHVVLPVVDHVSERLLGGLASLERRRS